MKYLCFLFVLCCTNVFADQSYDVVIYGGTSGAVTAAIQAKVMGKSVIIVSPDKHLGGLSSSGLGFTDSGNKDVVGGLSQEFYHRVWEHYQNPSVWTRQTKAEFGERSQGPPPRAGGVPTMWVFEPQVAESIFDAWINEYDIPLVREAYLDRSAGGVDVKNATIHSFKTLDGKTYRGKMFIDTTYEGDLMAAAGVSYHVGREANSVYNERYNGVQTGVFHHPHYFAQKVDPYVVPGDPSSGLLPKISDQPPGEKGSGDKRIQAYCFRMCLSNHPDNRIPFAKPADYNAGDYALLSRALAVETHDLFSKFDLMPNRKTDTNNHGPFSTDNIGMNYDYPEATYERRQEIIAEHESYQKGLMYFMSHDPSVPQAIRNRMQTWGLAADEFQDNGGWPHQLYIREARRMIGHYVMTEHDCLDRVPTPDSVGMGSYTLDSHNVQRYVTEEGFVQNEGDIGIHTPRPYEIAYGSMVPKQEECRNLFVPVCISSSHMAFGSIRMEPVFMVLGQSAATAAVMAIDANCDVQSVPYSELSERLISDGQVLTYEVAYERPTSKLPGIVVDDEDAKRLGKWTHSTSSASYLDSGYHHDGNEHDPETAIVFDSQLKPGVYEVRFSYPPNANRATNTRLSISHSEGTTTVAINQRKVPPLPGGWISLGKFKFGESGSVRVETSDADGYVVADAVQWLPR
ncbi:Xanthan lyase precursor [Rubripirellula amarantea]|uniref:Xanthan lyase n=1 Tax=Rubripirellula amarantea TaxID=2527999 RepID=A0A5C5WKM4_9BACT|nr:FAD-dependent oxidoreductase [Rubripirellula amarantea]TWT51167.1 Xanthan lyase precursor [Rubripirellula amarantea]